MPYVLGDATAECGNIEYHIGSQRYVFQYAVDAYSDAAEKQTIQDRDSKWIVPACNLGQADMVLISMPWPSKSESESVKADIIKAFKLIVSLGIVMILSTIEWIETSCGCIEARAWHIKVCQSFNVIELLCEHFTSPRETIHSRQWPWYKEYTPRDLSQFMTTMKTRNLRPGLGRMTTWPVLGAQEHYEIMEITLEAQRDGCIQYKSRSP